MLLCALSLVNKPIRIFKISPDSVAAGRLNDDVGSHNSSCEGLGKDDDEDGSNWRLYHGLSTHPLVFSS